MVIFKVYYAHGFFYCFHFMTFLKDMFRESEFAFCVSEIFHMFFKSCVEVSVGSFYIFLHCSKTRIDNKTIREQKSITSSQLSDNLTQSSRHHLSTHFFDIIFCENVNKTDEFSSVYNFQNTAENFRKIFSLMLEVLLSDCQINNRASLRLRN